MEKEVTWNTTVVKVIKNKIAPPFKEAIFDVMYNEWISKVWEVLDIWVQSWIIKKSGAFYSYWDKKLGQWRENAKWFLKEKNDLLNEIDEVIRNSL
jgi:recombination protein RecA